MLPGVFFNYELSPLRAHIEEKRRSAVHFLTRLFGVVGGVFVVAGVADAFVYALLQDMKGRGRGLGGGALGLAKD